jgi:hypothetical protein
VIAKAGRQLRSLFYSEKPPELPALDTLYDKLTANALGESFLTLLQNKAKLSSLTKEFLHSIKHRFIEKATEWSKAKLRKYYDEHIEFLRTLLALLEVTGRQPARRLELLSIKIYNTEFSLRNIFIHKGLLCTVQLYNKGNTNTGKPFYSVRHFPLCVSQILY